MYRCKYRTKLNLIADHTNQSVIYCAFEQLPEIYKTKYNINLRIIYLGIAFEHQNCKFAIELFLFVGTK